MKRSSYGLPTRIHASRWLYLLALAGLPVVGVAQVQTTYPTAWNPAYGGWAYEYSGTGATARPGTVVFTGNSSVPSNTPSTYTVGGRAASEVSGGRVFLNSTNDFDVPGSGGKKVPTTVRAPIDPASMGKALGRFAARVATPLAVGSAIYDLLKEFDVIVNQNMPNADNTFGKQTPGTTVVCRTSTGDWGSSNVDSIPPGPQPSWNVSAFSRATNPAASSVGQPCQVGRTLVNPSGGGGSGDWLYVTGVILSVPTGSTTALTEQQLADMIAAKSGWPTSSAVARAVAQAMNSPVIASDPANTVKVESPTITGPGSTTTGTTTTTNPDGSTVTRTNSTNITYNGPNITTSTTTVTNNTTNNTTTTTTTTSTGTGDSQDPCKGNPDRAGCARLDVPEGEIPKKNFVVTYVAENLFGTGSCPADKFANIGGHSVKVWDWQQSCAYLLNYVKPLIIALATFAAYFMLSPGKTE